MCQRFCQGSIYPWRSVGVIQHDSGFVHLSILFLIQFLFFHEKINFDRKSNHFFFSFLYNSFDATVLFDDVFRPISTAPSLNVIDSVYRWSYPSYGCITLLISKFLYLISLWLHLYHVKVIYILL